MRLTKIMMPDPWSITPKHCLLCAHQLTPYEAQERSRGTSFGMCQKCAKAATKVGRSKAHLVIESPDGEFDGGIFMKSEFLESLKPGIYRAVYTADEELVKLFDTGWDQTKDCAAFLELNPDHTVVEEAAFTWPAGMVIEIWDHYKYSGTYVVTETHELQQMMGVTPIGTRAAIHNDFGEREPHLRYRRLLDPNWQMSLTDRIAEWRGHEQSTGDFHSEASGLRHLEGWTISPEFKDVSYDYWRHVG